MGQTRSIISLEMKICLSIIAVFLYGILSSLAITAQVPDTGEFDYQVYLPIISKEIAKLSAVAFIVDEGVHSLWIANIDGSGEEKILDQIDVINDTYISDDRWFYRVNWSPNGKWLAVNRYGGLWLLTPDGDNLTELVPTNWGGGNVITGFAWSSDSTKIIFLQRFDSVTKFLGLVDLVTGEISYLIDEPTSNYGLSWSPDNLWIAFYDNGELSAFNLQTKEIIPIGYTCQGGYINSLSWNPQSDRLLVQDVGNGRYSHGESCIITLEGQNINLDVGGSSGEPFWSVNGEELLVSATNFDPDDPELEEDPRVLKFDRSGQYVERLNLVAEIGYLPEISPDRQNFLSWIANEQDWQTGYIQIACLDEGLLCSKKAEVNMIGRLANINDMNAIYMWDATGENGLFLSVYNFYYWMDLNLGSIYAFNKSSGGLTQVTNVHMIRYATVSPVH